MENQDDINKQSIAGGTSTGAHGTSVTFKSVENQISAMTIINGRGEEVHIDETSPYFQGARLSPGSLGVIRDLNYKLSKAYKLKVRSFAADFNQRLVKFEERLMGNRHLEMFYFPVGDWSHRSFPTERSKCTP